MAIFGVKNIVANMERCVYWPMTQVARVIKGCILCYTNEPSNKKQGPYNPLMIPTRSWESITMDFDVGPWMTRRGHDYMYVVVTSSMGGS